MQEVTKCRICDKILTDDDIGYYECFECHEKMKWWDKNKIRKFMGS